VGLRRVVVAFLDFESANAMNVEHSEPTEPEGDRIKGDTFLS
jgi:hypothetical protein